MPTAYELFTRAVFCSASFRNGIDRFKWQRPFTKGKFASTVHGLHVLDPIQGGILSLPIQFLFLFFLMGPLGPGSARSWHIRALAPTIGRHTRPPTHATFGTDWESVGSAEPGHDGPAVAARFARGSADNSPG